MEYESTDATKGQPIESPRRQGWICPKCGRVNAPWVAHCPCYFGGWQPAPPQPWYPQPYCPQPWYPYFGPRWTITCGTADTAYTTFQA